MSVVRETSDCMLIAVQNGISERWFPKNHLVLSEKFQCSQISH